ncbi:response regulator [Noviherbaspirillum massiliense]|uniref:response regulator n=1 Tax=Noviherbaspirillum massiliense TaxID=1465823 RepID=UPI0002E8CE33|nr:response regulator [Noviherbaspirillum massiliense]
MESPTKLPTRTLVVEDNPDFAQLIRDILEIKGCEARVASNARNGLKAAQEMQPDIIFCDIGLPGELNGLEFARALRADANLSRTPLVAVSGYTSEADRLRAIEAGFDMVFPKPVKFADLTAALERFAT